MSPGSAPTAEARPIPAKETTPAGSGGGEGLPVPWLFCPAEASLPEGLPGGGGAHLEASLRGLLRLIALIRREPAEGGPLGRLPPAAAAAGAVGAILALALSRSLPAAAPTLLLLALQVALLPPAPRGRVLRSGLAAGGLALLILAPAIPMGLQSPARAGLFLLRAAGAALAAAIPAATLPPHDLLGRLGALGVPGTVRMILDQTLRSLLLLGEAARELLEALSVRSLGGRRRFAPLAWIVGTLFLRSAALAGRTAEALTARGYDGDWPLRPRSLDAPDFLYLSLLFAALAASAFLAG